MNSGPPKDAPPAPPEFGPSDPLDNDLLTSEDLFGDMVDALPEAPAVAAPSGRRKPIKVQVGESPAAAPLVSPEAADLLLNALGSDEGPPALTPPEPLRPPFPEPEPAAAGGEVDVLLDALGGPAAEPEAPPPSPPRLARAEPAPSGRAHGASPLTGHAEEFASLLDGLGPDEDTGPPLAPALAAPPPAVAPEPPPARKPARPAAPRAKDPLERLARASGEALGPERAAAAPAAARTGTKFRAAAAKTAPEEGALLDLAQVAETALGHRTHPVIHVEPGAGKARPPGERAAFGPYQLLDRVAVGGMAEVFRAKRQGVEGFGKIVAVKRILPHLSDNKEFVDMFVHEAKMVAGLTHPNIVQIFDLGKLESSYYIAMEFVHGRDLRSIQKRAQDRGVRVPLDLSALVVSKVCSALEYAHRKRDDRGRALQIVHRDVSPQNILISFEGDVKLTDFGIAKAASQASITDRGALRGKLLYMSPEQAWGQAIDRRADIFSLGVVFYELVTGHKPFLASSEVSILDAVRECRVAPPTTINPRLPDKLAAVVMKALDRDPEQRYQDAAEMYRDLDRVLHERQVPAAPELSRLMHVLYDERERGDVVAEEEGGEKVQLEFDTPAEKRGTPAGQDPSIDKLLKRFGIQ